MTQKRRQGFVLVTVLWVIAILTVLTLSLGRAVALERRAAAYTLDQARANHLARSAVERGLLELQRKPMADFLRQEHGITHTGQAWAQPMNLRSEPGLLTTTPDTASDVVLLEIEDLEAKLNINHLPESMIWELPGLVVVTARELMSQRARRGGTGPLFHIVEELRDLTEVKDSDWYGTAEQVGLREMLTVYGTGRVNVNTASPEVLLMIPGLDDRAVNALTEVRAGADGVLNTPDDQGFLHYDDITRRTGIKGAPRQALIQYCSVDSWWFKIRGTATLRQGSVRAVYIVVVEKSEDTWRIVDWTEETIED